MVTASENDVLPIDESATVGDAAPAGSDKGAAISAEDLEAHHQWWLTRNLRQPRGRQLVRSDADFRHSDVLKGLDLRGAALQRAQMQGADLTDTRLQDADLWDADLTDGKGLRLHQLGGANLSGALLPASLPSFDAPLKMIEAMSQNAGKLFLSNLGLCVITYFIVAQTQDVQLFSSSNVGNTKLPFIDVQVSVRYFYLIVPVAFLCAYAYFHLQLLRLWEALRRLPAIFPDGTTQDQNTFPWQLTDLVRNHFWHLRPRMTAKGSASAAEPEKAMMDSPALHRLQWGLSVFLAWVVLPLTLLYPWSRYLVRRDLAATAGYCLSIAVACWLMMNFYHLTKIILRQGDALHARWRRPWTDGGGCGRTLVACGVFAFLGYLSVNIIKEQWSFGPHLAQCDLSGTTMTGDDFRFADLREANLSKSYLSHTDFYDADLTRANLTGTQLTGARLDYAEFNSAKMQGVNLMGATLTHVKGQYADVSDAKMRHVDLDNAMLDHAKITDSQMAGAKMTYALVEGADLRRTNLTRSNLTFTWLEEARLDHAVLVDANMVHTKLANAVLDGADLRGADMTGADLQGTHVKGALFSKETKFPDKSFASRHPEMILREPAEKP